MFEKDIVIGDNVVLNIPNDNWDWGYRPVEKQNGTIAKVLGFDKIHYSRINNFGNKPGVYVNRAWVIVEVPNKEPFSISSCFVETEKPRKKIEKEFLRDLPETKFYEGDYVSTQEYPEIMIVGVEFVKNNSEYYTYRISDGFNSGWYTSVKEPEIELIKRGNIWKYYHNEFINFKNIEEEANFHKLLGLFIEVKNPNNNLYSWTKDEVLQAIKEGIVDGFSVEGNVLTNKSSIMAIKFNDKNLGNKLRNVMLKNFDLTA